METSEFNASMSGKAHVLTLEETRYLARNAQILTLERAKALKGKTIFWTYFGYEANVQVVSKMTVGDIVSEWDYNKTQPLRASMGYANRTAYWEAEFSESAKQKFKEKLVLLNEKGEDTLIYCYTGVDNCFDELTFTCSDADRAVLFVECNED